MFDPFGGFGMFGNSRNYDPYGRSARQTYQPQHHHHRNPRTYISSSDFYDPYERREPHHHRHLRNDHLLNHQSVGPAHWYSEREEQPQPPPRKPPQARWQQSNVDPLNESFYDELNPSSLEYQKYLLEEEQAYRKKLEQNRRERERLRALDSIYPGLGSSLANEVRAPNVLPKEQYYYQKPNPAPSRTKTTYKVVPSGQNLDDSFEESPEPQPKPQRTKQRNPNLTQSAFGFGQSPFGLFDEFFGRPAPQNYANHPQEEAYMAEKARKKQKKAQVQAKKDEAKKEKLKIPVESSESSIEQPPPKKKSSKNFRDWDTKYPTSVPHDHHFHSTPLSHSQFLPTQSPYSSPYSSGYMHPGAAHHPGAHLDHHPVHPGLPNHQIPHPHPPAPYPTIHPAYNPYSYPVYLRPAFPAHAAFRGPSPRETDTEELSIDQQEEKRIKRQKEKKGGIVGQGKVFEEVEPKDVKDVKDVKDGKDEKEASEEKKQGEDEQKDDSKTE